MKSKMSVAIGSLRASQRLYPLLAVAFLTFASCARGAHDPLVSDRASSTSTASADSKGIVATANTSISLFDLESSWRDVHGRTVSLRDVSSKVNVLAMIYTSCTVTCPLIIADLKRIEGSLSPADLPHVRFLLVSLDPDRDTPGRLETWARETRLDETRWVLLSGHEGTVRELAATLEVRYRKLDDGEIAHTNGINIVDQAGRLSHHTEGIGQTDRSAQAVQVLLRQSSTISQPTTGTK